MASLAKCPSCKFQIARDADVCPSCGTIDPNNKKGVQAWTNLLTGAVILGVVLIFGTIMVMLIPIFATYGYLYRKRII